MRRIRNSNGASPDLLALLADLVAPDVDLQVADPDLLLALRAVSGVRRNTVATRTTSTCALNGLVK